MTEEGRTLFEAGLIVRESRDVLLKELAEAKDPADAAIIAGMIDRIPSAMFLLGWLSGHDNKAGVTQ